MSFTHSFQLVVFDRFIFSHPVVIHPYTKMSKRKDDLARLTFIVKINYFHIEIKVMNVRNTSYHDDTLMCQTLYDYAKDKRSCGPNQ